MDQNSQKKESLELYRSLFRGRTDVYAYRWQNGDGRSGYSPARKHKDGPYLPLTDPAVINHLAGKTTIGLYPLLQDNTTWFFPLTSTESTAPPWRMPGRWLDTALIGRFRPIWSDPGLEPGRTSGSFFGPCTGLEAAPIGLPCSAARGGRRDGRRRGL